MTQEADLIDLSVEVGTVFELRAPTPPDRDDLERRLRDTVVREGHALAARDVERLPPDLRAELARAEEHERKRLADLATSAPPVKSRAEARKEWEKTAMWHTEDFVYEGE